MKNLFFTIPLALLFGAAQAATITAVVNNGNWATNTTWDLNRQPGSTDIVIIPANKTVIITSNLNNGDDLTIRVYGTLKMSGGKLKIGTGGSIIVYGSITSNQGANEQIRIGNTLVFQGNQGQNGSILGPQQALGSSATPAFSPFVPLPVKFVGFSLSRTNSDVLVQWSTSEEINANVYIIERSSDGISWISIATVTAAGNTSTLSNYSYTDRYITVPVIYYRVKEIDLNGSFAYTSIRSIKNETTSKTDIRVTSVQNKVLMLFSQKVTGNVVVRFISLAGQVVDQQTINQPSGQVILNSKVQGHYIISVSNGKDVNTSSQIIL